jgi:hypothetical protein
LLFYAYFLAVHFSPLNCPLKKQSLIPVFGFSKFDFASPFHPAHTQKLLFLFQYSTSSSISFAPPLIALTTFPTAGSNCKTAAAFRLAGVWTLLF